MVSYGFDEGIEYTPYQKVHPQNNQEITDYQITIEMAKEIAMLQRNEKGKEARQYFIEIEKEWNNPDRIMERALSIARKRIDDLKVELELQRPKIDFYDTVAGSKDAVEMGNVAKVLNINGIGRNNLFEFLRNQKILQSNNIPYQKYIDSRYFRVIEQKYTTSMGETKITFKTLVFQKGIEFIKKRIDESYFVKKKGEEHERNIIKI